MTHRAFALIALAATLLAALLLAGTVHAATQRPDYAKIADLIEDGKHHQLVRTLGKSKHWPPELQGIRKACRTEAARAIKAHSIFDQPVIKAAAPVGPHSIDNEPGKRRENPTRITGKACSDLRKVATAIDAMLNSR